jgi:hypothetical protein
MRFGIKTAMNVCGELLVSALCLQLETSGLCDGTMETVEIGLLAPERFWRMATQSLRSARRIVK